MLIKAVTFFLVALVVLAMFGKFRPKLRLPGMRRRADLPPRPEKCARCGTYLIGKAPCACGGRKGPKA